MRIDREKVRAPEIGRLWLNSPPLSLRQLRGKAVLIDFWDYTCVNCIRTLPYVHAWHERYAEKGLVVIGVHTPEFTFAQYESNVERGVREFGLTYPIVIDSNFELWKAFANKYWPAKYLIDKEGYIRGAHFGEGAYAETEQIIQELLREIDPAVVLPKIMEPLRDTDVPEAICFRPTPELYLGYRRGRIGNQSGFHEGGLAEYSISGEPQENFFYVQGTWNSTAEYLESASTNGKILVPYSAGGVNLVMASRTQQPLQVMVRQDCKPLGKVNATAETKFAADGSTYINVERARMYALVNNHSFEVHTLELAPQGEGVAMYAFTFTTCVEKPSATIAGAER
jgi:thiol-disulfide isomerase/thioredoxin